MSALVLSGGDALAVSLAPSAVAQRDAAVTSASFVDLVETPEQLAEAVEAIRQLRDLEKSAESSRVQVKAPVLAAQRAIDERAREFTAPIVAERARIDGLVNAYNRRMAEAARRAEQERREAIERARREEEERIRQLREQQAAREAEAARVAAEAAKVLGDEDPKKAAEHAVVCTRIDAARETQAIIDQSRDQQRQAIITTAAAVAPPKPAGMSIRREPQFRVTDPAVLAAARPDLVTITPRAREITAAVKQAGEWDGEREVCPGLVAWWQDKTLVR